VVKRQKVKELGARLMQLSAMLPLAASGLVIGTGLFLLLRPFTAPEDAAIPVTILPELLCGFARETFSRSPKARAD